MDMLSLVALINFFSPKVAPNPEAIYANCISHLTEELKQNKVNLTIECRNSISNKMGKNLVYSTKDIVFVSSKNKMLNIISGSSTEIKDIHKLILINDLILLKNKNENRIIGFNLTDSGNISPAIKIDIPYEFIDFKPSGVDKSKIVTTKKDGSIAQENIPSIGKKD